MGNSMLKTIIFKNDHPWPRVSGEKPPFRPLDNMPKIIIKAILHYFEIIMIINFHIIIGIFLDLKVFSNGKLQEVCIQSSLKIGFDGISLQLSNLWGFWQSLIIITVVDFVYMSFKNVDSEEQGQTDT